MHAFLQVSSSRHSTHFLLDSHQEIVRAVQGRDAIFRFPGRADVTAMFGVLVLLKDPILIVGSKHLLFRSQKAMFVDLKPFLSIPKHGSL